MKTVSVRTGVVLMAALLAILVFASSAGIGPAQPPAQDPMTVAAVQASPPAIYFQGRLLDPATGQPRSDGSYPMAFNLYAAAEGGASLWAEAKGVTIHRGLFTTLLGDSAPLNLALFNGQDLWLGITVGADPEALPRQRLAYVPYSLYTQNAQNAQNAGALDGLDSTAFAGSTHTHAGDSIVDNSIAAADIQDFTRVLAFPAGALSYDSTIITPDSAGLDWASTFQGGATLNLTRPTDWDPATDVTLRIYFAPKTGAAGNVAFFIRPRSYDPGDTYQDISNIGYTPVPATGAYKIQVQTFTIPAARMAKQLWVIAMQRGATGETYTDLVRVIAVDLNYTAVR